MPHFIHLRVYSDYSLGSGAIRIKDLVKSSVTQKFPALALTDKNNLFASLEYSMEALKYGIQPIIGIDICVNYGKDLYGNLLLLAKDQVGYSNLLKLASNLYLKRTFSKQLSISLEELLELSDGLIVLAANPIDSIEHRIYTSKSSTETLQFLPHLKDSFKDRLYIELIRKTGQIQHEQAFEDLVIDYSYKNNIPLVATNYASFLDPTFYEAQDTLSCIAGGRYILEEERPRLPKDFYLKNTSEMQDLFADIPEAINNTINIAKRCVIHAQTQAPLLPKFIQDLTVSEEETIRLEATEGLKKRIVELLNTPQERAYFDRLEFELSVINKMQYAGYFLIVSDFIRWSKHQGIPVGPGRGSGVGSIVAWALEITDLDPIKFGLLFERFLNPDRVSLPDFDIDFCQERREEVIEYVKHKYGADKVAQIITFGKLQARAVLRDVGRVLHMPYGVIDKICKMVPNNPANPVTLGEAIKLDKELQKSRDADPEINKLLRISLQLEGINRHVSTHAAGIVIADRPIVDLVPLYCDEVGGMPAVQYSMKYAEAAGLIKFDFLGLKTLTVISWTLKYLKARGINLNILELPLDDLTTYKLLSRGATTGVFQFESAGMKESIKRLKPDSIGDLIALGSLYRPGPMDNIPSYINRKHGIEKPEYLHPLMEKSLQETYGIIVYQEQVMEIARSLAGYTLGSADLLRRAMGKKIKSEMEAQREIFVSGCVARGIDKSKAREIFVFIEKFASYGFNKSHAAAYALISYQTAYLKANHTIEFLVASINSEIHDTDKINLFLQEAKNFNIEVLLPDINKSEAMFSIEGDSIRFGLGAIKSVGVAAISKVIEERKNGQFKDIYNFVERCGKGYINRRMFENLCRAGSLDNLNDNRAAIIESVEALLKYSQEYNEEKDSAQVGLFSLSKNELDQKPTLANPIKWSLEEALRNEFDAFGFYLSSHPLAAYATKLKKLGVVESDKVEAIASSKGTKVTLAGAITSRKVKSSKRGKYALIQISDRSGLIEVSLFNEELLIKNDAVLQVGRLIFLTADARVDDTGLRIMIDSLSSIEEALGRVSTSLSIIIKNQEDIEAIKGLVGDFGKKVNFTLKLSSGELVSFRGASAICISPENEAKLRQMNGIEVVEY